MSRSEQLKFERRTHLRRFKVGQVRSAVPEDAVSDDSVWATGQGEVRRLWADKYGAQYVDRDADAG